MKGYKFLVFLLLIASLLFLSSCWMFDRHPYIDASKVESVQIIELGKFVDREVGHEYTVLAEVADCEAFIDRLNKIETNEYWGGPMMMYEGDVVIRINYENNGYDLIGTKITYHWNRTDVSDGGKFYYNEEQFDALISDYKTGDGFVVP